MMKKRLLLLILAIVCCLTSISCLDDSEDVKEITDISRYSELSSLFYTPIFPETIPENAEVNDFLYYRYYSYFDYYLELQFADQESFWNFVNQRGEAIKKEARVVEEKNEMNNSYIEWHTSEMDAGLDNDNRRCHYYQIKKQEETLHFSGLYLTLSYSENDLCVIMSKFYLSNIDRIPKYLLRFNVPIEDGVEHIIYLD